MISVENIAISFNGNFLFKKVSFQLKNGAKVGLAGKNGAGKSTLLKLLTGELDYDEGNLVIPKGYKIGYLRQDLVQQGDNSVREEAMKAFSNQADMDTEYERISKELEQRTDYESDEYAELIQKISDLGARLEMSDSSQNVINEFVNNLLARDSMFLRKEIQKVTPDIELSQEINIEGDTVKVDVPMTVNFFWPES